MVDVKLIPLEVLLGNPERVGAQISPDGKRLSYLAPLDGVMNVIVGEAGLGNERPVTHDTGRGIQSYLWAHDDRHLMYVRDKDGSEDFRLYDVDLETGVERDLTPLDGVQCRVIAHCKEFPNDVLIAMNKDNPELHDVYQLDLTTGALKKIVDNPGFLDWVIDTDLKVRGAVTPLPDGGAVIMVRDDEDSDWRPLLEVPPEDAELTAPLGFTRDGKAMYLRMSVDANTGRLVKMDIATGTVEVIAEDPSYDIAGAMMNPDTRAIEAVTLYRDRLEYQIFDDAVRGDIDALQRLDTSDLAIIGRDHDDSTWLVAFESDSGPVKFYTWDRASKTATFLFDHQPQLNNYPLVPMEPFAFTSRDGLAIHGYLTFPSQVVRTDLPASAGAWRAMGPRPTSTGWQGAVARQPRIPLRPSQFPRLQRVWQGLSQRGRSRVGWQDARRSARRHRSPCRAGHCRPRAHCDLWHFLWWLRRVGWCDVHPQRLQVCDFDGRPVGLEHAHRVVSRVLEAHDRDVAQASRRGQGIPLVAFAAVESRRHQDPHPYRPGRERSPREKGGVRADRRGHERARDRSRVRHVRE